MSSGKLDSMLWGNNRVCSGNKIGMTMTQLVLVSMPQCMSILILTINS